MSEYVIAPKAALAFAIDNMREDDDLRPCERCGVPLTVDEIAPVADLWGCWHVVIDKPGNAKCWREERACLAGPNTLAGKDFASAPSLDSDGKPKIGEGR